MDYATLVKLAIKDAYIHERRISMVRRVYVNKLFERLYCKYPKFMIGLYHELFDESNYDDNGVLISCEFNFKFKRLVKTLESNYNIKVYGHVEIWRGDVLDINDVRYGVLHVLAERFVKNEEELNNE